MGNINEMFALYSRRQRIKEELERQFHEDEVRRKIAFEAQMKMMEKSRKKKASRLRDLCSKKNIAYRGTEMYVMIDGVKHIYSLCSLFATNEAKNIIIDFMRQIGEVPILNEEGFPTNDDIEWHFFCGLDAMIKAAEMA